MLPRAVASVKLLWVPPVVRLKTSQKPLDLETDVRQLRFPTENCRNTLFGAPENASKYLRTILGDVPCNIMQPGV